MAETLRLDYDDNAMDIMDKVNAVLAATGWQFVDDDETHDGWCLYTLVQEKET